MSIQPRRTLPFICPECRGECYTLREWLTCHPRTVRAFMDQLIEREHEDDRYFNRVVSNRASGALRREARARLAAQKEASHVAT